jgi:hypothetical protein
MQEVYYLDLVQSENRKPLIEHLQAPIKTQLPAERHKLGCRDTSRYTLHGLRERQLQGWLGPVETIPICRVRCEQGEALFEWRELAELTLRVKADIR